MMIPNCVCIIGSPYQRIRHRRQRQPQSQPQRRWSSSFMGSWHMGYTQRLSLRVTTWPQQQQQPHPRIEVVSFDYRGHGDSPGLRGYIPNAQTVRTDGIAVIQYVQRKYPNRTLFLLGSSLGGNIALSVAHQLHVMAVAEETTKADPNASIIHIRGVILLAPMLKLHVDDLSRWLLSGLATLVPTWPIIPSASTGSSERQYRDPVKRLQCDTDPKCILGTGTIRVASAATCVELTCSIQQNFQSIACPFLILLAEEDTVVDNQGSLDLMEQAISKDKTMNRYPALHGLLCEPSPLSDQIQADILQWIQDRS